MTVRKSLRVRSRNIAPKSYNERDLADATASRTLIIPAPSSKKPLIKKPLKSKSRSKSPKAAPPSPTKPSGTKLIGTCIVISTPEEQAKQDALLAPQRKEYAARMLKERLAREKIENMAEAKKQFGKGEVRYKIFQSGGDGKARNREVERMVGELRREKEREIREGRREKLARKKEKKKVDGRKKKVVKKRDSDDMRVISCGFNPVV